MTDDAETAQRIGLSHSMTARLKYSLVNATVFGCNAVLRLSITAPTDQSARCDPRNVRKQQWMCVAKSSVRRQLLCCARYVVVLGMHRNAFTMPKPTSNVGWPVRPTGRTSGRDSYCDRSTTNSCQPYMSKESHQHHSRNAVHFSDTTLRLLQFVVSAVETPFMETLLKEKGTVYQSCICRRLVLRETPVDASRVCDGNLSCCFF